MPDRSGGEAPRRTLEELVARARKVSADSFAAQTRTPYLIRLGSTLDPDAVERARAAVRTVHPETTAHRRRPGRPLEAYAVAKKPGANAFGFMITLGRTNNNDIAIEEEPVSKFHASLTQDAGGPWTIADMSRNGTWLDGVKLPPRAVTPLRSGAAISLAEAVPLRFFEPADLYAFLKSLKPDET